MPQGIYTPGVRELPQGEETPVVATEREGVPREDRRGQVGDGTPPHHPRNQGGGDQRQRQREDRRARYGAAAAPLAGHGGGRRQRGTPHRRTASTDGTRPKNGTHSRREYGLLAPTGPAVNPAAARKQVRADGHQANRGTAEQVRKETETGEGTRQHAFPARVMQVVDDEEQRPPERSRSLNSCNHQGARPRRAARNQWGNPRYGSARP